jgi:hypothetical protein
MQNSHYESGTVKMNNTMSMIFQKSDSDYNKQIRTLVLSTNVNDYDTGEPIVDNNIKKTLISSQTVDNPIFSMLHGIKIGRKYHAPEASRDTISSDQDSEFIIPTKIASYVIE